MAWSQSAITGVRPPSPAVGGVLIQWASTAPAGTLYQVYVARRLAWSGTAKKAIVPRFPTGARVDVGTVGPSEKFADFSGSLAAAYADRASLSWLGGSYLDASGNDDVAGFRVYGSAVAGGAVVYTTLLANIPAYQGGIVADGYGLGGYGQGGWGRAAASYSWTSPKLKNGTWTFAVRPYDAAGNEATGSTTAVVISAPPTAPPRFSDGTRLHYTYSAVSKQATLTWNAST